MKFVNFIKKEPVLFAAILLAFISVLFVRPEPVLVFNSIDFRVICLLFCLMIVIQAFRTTNLLDWIALKLLSFCKNQKSLYFVLVFIVFFISMLVTNDVALLTFVPLTILICEKANHSACKLIILETLAANLGSSVTPMGNPQNLFLYSFFNFSTAEFFRTTLIIGIPSIVILTIMILFICRNRKNDEKTTFFLQETEQTFVKIDFRFWVYFVCLIFSLLTVFRIVDYRITLFITIVLMLICNKKLFKNVDYGLLLTFAGFFIFIGCLSALPQVSNYLKSVLSSAYSTYLAGIFSSQVISNVPAAILLSGFTANPKELLLGVNVGGLGTLIASLASVISFKLYKNSDSQSCTESFFVKFSVYNIGLLIILGIVVWTLNSY